MVKQNPKSPKSWQAGRQEPPDESKPSQRPRHRCEGVPAMHLTHFILRGSPIFLFPLNILPSIHVDDMAAKWISYSDQLGINILEGNVWWMPAGSFFILLKSHLCHVHELVLTAATLFVALHTSMKCSPTDTCFASFPIIALKTPKAKYMSLASITANEDHKHHCVEW